MSAAPEAASPGAVSGQLAAVHIDIPGAKSNTPMVVDSSPAPAPTLAAPARIQLNGGDGQAGASPK